MRVFQTKVAFMASRRVLIGTGSAAAIVYGPGCRRSAADERPETNSAVGAAGVASDRRLSPALPQTRDTVRALRSGIDGLTDQETAKHSGMARPRREDGHA